MRPTEIIELGAVITFLNFHRILYTGDQLIAGEQNDSVDIYFDKANLRFQITTVEGGSIRLFRDKQYSSRTNADEAIHKYIINPILKKTERYKGKSTENITLLIHTTILPPLDWFNPEDEGQKKLLEKTYLRSGFKDIYLVQDIPNNVICLYKA